MTETERSVIPVKALLHLTSQLIGGEEDDMPAWIAQPWRMQTQESQVSVGMPA